MEPKNLKRTERNQKGNCGCCVQIKIQKPAKYLL